MPNITLTDNEVRDLVMLLGAASAAFEELRDDGSTVGLVKRLIGEYAIRADELLEVIKTQHNAQVRKD